MATMRGTRVPVGSASWINEERTTALSIVQAEAEDNVAEIFKTPGKLRSKTPRTARKVDNGEPRVPLSDVFSATPKAAPSTFMQQLARASTPKVNLAKPTSSPLGRTTSPRKAAASPRLPVPKQPVVLADSGYYGSQDVDNMDVDLIEDQTEVGEPRSSPPKTAGRTGHVAFDAEEDEVEEDSPRSPTVTRTIRSPEVTFQTAKEERTTRTMRDITEEAPSPSSEASDASSPAKQADAPSSPVTSPGPRVAQVVSPKKNSPIKQSPIKQVSPPVEAAASPEPEHMPLAESQDDVDVHMDDDTRSPSDDESSPIRPVRKSSLNFASLPAREPLKNKSIGARVSRTSHLETNRQSYYGRHTGGKSLGNNAERLTASDEDEDEEEEEGNDYMTIDGPVNATKNSENFASNHNKTYTQRLQDQINLLGKSQPNASRPSKSVPNSTVVQQLTQAPSLQSAAETKPASPTKKTAAPPTPGAFPDDEDDEDEDDDWIAPPVPAKDTPVISPRPQLSKSHTTDVMEGIEGADTVGGSEFLFPPQQQSSVRSGSPKHAPDVPERAPGGFGHGKSASVSALPDLSKEKVAEDISKKHISVSNPLSAVPEDGRPETPKSPTRSIRDSPLKQVKNKLSSILKSSKGLLASSAAISAEGKSSMMSPSTTRLGLQSGPSTDSVLPHSLPAEPLYPDLSKRMAADAQTIASTGSPERPVARRTRASVEKEKEDKRKEKEAKLMADQMSKLDRVRAEEREKARVFSKEQERIAAMEKKIAAQKERELEQEKEMLKSARTPAPKEVQRPTRTSPRKVKGQGELGSTAQPVEPEKADVDMMEAPTPRQPPSVPRSAGPGQAARPRELRRPTRPTKEAPSKTKQAPTVIRVNTGSQHSQYHPSNSTLSSGLQDTLSSSVKSKTSQPGSHSKQSLQSLKSSVSSNGRPKALELAAKRKEQEEREAQRKKDAKLELERKRAAIQEEERKQDLQRRQDAERQREREREQQSEAKKNAQRQAAIERAKQTRAPPPAARSQPNGPPDYAASQRSDGQPARPPSRLNSAMHRSQDDRPVNTVLSNPVKAPSKRPLPQDGNEEGSARKPLVRNGPSYQAKDAKRRRTSDDFADELDMDIQPPNIKGPPVRPPSVGFKKDMPTKSMYGYTNVPPSASRDLFKSTVTAQHNSTIKSSKQVDMAQFAQGHIPFAPNPNPAGPAHKTPARPMGAATTKSAAKSAARSSPRFQDGEKIELPEIDTDEDEDEDESHFGVAAWADSPDLRRALMRQETMNPEGIFGPPRALNMEEVFSNKERWHKFRARTSSANWSGSDRLTEDEIRKDLAARDKLRKEGGWSYEMSKDLI
ncbi:Inner centromere protein-related protein pic1 [Colletotrichum chlorophyti]|uniref:Inner centromere protein-related protein pic1 n=1 Tax=Colletotrichum chlorophyti TaxID=708187 RepID=A0A1Q8RUI5_9PEZI|nr:Inner centromere protein-related protein pic1 [Colletotrichum chlorophyti]